PQHDQRARRDLGAQPAQHVDGMIATGPVIRPDPHLSFVIQIQTIERDLGLQTRRGCGNLEALAALAPAIAEVNILVDMRLIEIDQVMALIARTIQQRANLGNESLALLRIGTTEQRVGLFPRQLEPVQRAADGLAAAAAAKLCLHEASQTPQRPTRLYIGSGNRRTGGLTLRGAN